MDAKCLFFTSLQMSCKIQEKQRKYIDFILKQYMTRYHHKSHTHKGKIQRNLKMHQMIYLGDWRYLRNIVQGQGQMIELETAHDYLQYLKISVTPLFFQQQILHYSSMHTLPEFLVETVFSVYKLTRLNIASRLSIQLTSCTTPFSHNHPNSTHSAQCPPF